MKKNVLSGIEDIKKEREMSKENEKKIKGKIIANGAIAILMMALIIILLVISKSEEKNLSVFTYNIAAVQLLILALIILEIGYKKDDGGIALSGLEILVLSIITLFSPYIFLKFSYNAINAAAAVIDLYYIIKIIVIYNSEKNRILQEKSDIPDIIKKESKDELVKEFENKRKQAIEKETVKAAPAKRGRKPKAETEQKTKTTKTTAKKASSKKETKNDDTLKVEPIENGKTEKLEEKENNTSLNIAKIDEGSQVETKVENISTETDKETTPKKTTRKRTTKKVDDTDKNSSAKKTTKKTSTASKTSSSKAKTTTKKTSTTKKKTPEDSKE